VSTRFLRIAPRRSGGGRGGSRLDWDRVGRVALVVVLFVIVALYVNPVVNFVDAWRDARSERASLAELKAENEELRHRADVLTDPDAAERAARKLGMVVPDERSVVIEGLDG
jgi:cell division protein FtsB